MEISGELFKPQKVSINIASPAFRSNYCGAYVQSLYATMSKSRNRPDISFEAFTEINYSDIEQSRNYLISNFYFNQKHCTHILFIDADMGFDPDLIFDMIGLRKEVVGTIYPKRQINLRRLHALSNCNFEKAYAMASEFVGPTQAEFNNNKFIKVDRVGAGILLISRECITKMIEKIPEILDNKEFKSLPFANEFDSYLLLFDKIKIKNNALSEDFSFCHRWKNMCNGEIYATGAYHIKHVGDMTFDSRFSNLA